jgi:hypothetical protein
MDSYEQLTAIAQQCPYFAAENERVLNSSTAHEKGINCTMCAHYDKGLCNIKDEILTSLDQT